jgi:septal ring factor EnvC (AmiA/AmiB activator)
MVTQISIQEWSELLSVILWPAVVIIVLFAFRKIIFKAFGKMKSFRVKDVEAEFYEREKQLTETEIMPLQDEIASLEERINSLETKISQYQTEDQAEQAEKDPETLRKELKSILSTGPYRWRSVNKLSMVSGASPEKLLPLLKNEQDIVIETTRSGKYIARLESR